MIANKANVTKRSQAGQPLTHTQVDNNFQEIKNVIDDTIIAYEQIAINQSAITETQSALTELGQTIQEDVSNNVENIRQEVINRDASVLSSANNYTNQEIDDLLSSEFINSSMIQEDVVTYDKIQDVSETSRILGRKSSGSGSIEELTISELLDFVDSASWGDILYRGETGWARLPASDSKKILSTNGSGANPSWETVTSLLSMNAGDIIIGQESGSVSGANGTITSEFYILTNGEYRINLEIDDCEVNIYRNDVLLHGPYSATEPYPTTTTSVDSSGWAAGDVLKVVATPILTHTPTGSLETTISVLNALGSIVSKTVSKDGGGGA